MQEKDQELEEALVKPKFFNFFFFPSKQKHRRSHWM